ncbi:MAG: hypothetical protein RQ968_05355 [Thermoproteota archaeon]|nr:hypothetical protein [Thermoproteota archaeon]
MEIIIDYEYGVMSMTANKPANEPYGYKIIHQPFDPEPRYIPGAKYKFHFYSGTDDLPGDREFEVVREAIREWNNIGGFSFIIEEEQKPVFETSNLCWFDGHNHIGWGYPWYYYWFIPIPNPCFLGNFTARAITHLWPKIFGREIIDADIAFNDDDNVIKWYELNLIMIARHELGHVISLDDLYNKSNLDQDKMQVMHSGFYIEWGDKAGARWMYPARYDVVSGWFGWETAESDATIGYIDYI